MCRLTSEKHFSRLFKLPELVNSSCLSQFELAFLSHVTQGILIDIFLNLVSIKPAPSSF